MLWAGVPLITCSGEAYASRMAGSLLNAIGMPELITNSTLEYETLALRLAENREMLDAIKMKLDINKRSHSLFDTKKFTRHLEEAYTIMYERYQADLPPDDIVLAG